MAETIARIQLLIDTTANWQAANPILLSGEIGLEIKPNHEIAFKVGNGTTSWNLLDYAVFTPSEVVAMRDELQDQIDNIVIAASEGGDSSTEVAQARVNASGVTYATLKARLDAMDATAETNKAEINAEITDLKSDLKNLNDELISMEYFTFNNDSNVIVTSNATYGIYFTEKTYVKSVTPVINGSGSVKYRFVYDETGNGFSNGSAVTFGELRTVDSGSTVPVNEYLDNHVGVMIYSSGIIKYCNAYTSDLTKAKVIQFVNGIDENAKSSTVKEKFNYCFAGTIVTGESKRKFAEDSELFTTSEKILVNDNNVSSSISSTAYALLLDEDKFIKSLTPVFSGSGGTFIYRYVYDSSGTGFAKGSAVNFGEIHNANCGDTIQINKVIGKKTGLVIYSSTNVLQYCNSSSSTFGIAKIMSVNKGNDPEYKSSTVREVINSCFAGSFLVDETESNFVTESEFNKTIEKTYNNNISISSVSAGIAYALYCTSDTFIKTIKPVFANGDTGTFIYRFVYSENSTGFTNNSAVIYGTLHTANCGDTITINQIINRKTGLVIYSENALRFCNTTNPAELPTAKIMSVLGAVNESNTSGTAKEIMKYGFAGTFVVNEKESKFVTREDVVNSNYIYGKKIMAIGDSMTAGHSLGTAKAWLNKIAVRNGMTAYNRGTNGAFMADYQYESHDNSVYQKLCVSESEYYISDADMASYDYILIYAGTNDCANNKTIGDVSSTNVKEFCGALNAICQALQTRAPQAHIAFITPYLRSGIESRCQNYVDAINNVCAKYSIPVFDNSKNGSICWSNSAIVSALTLNDTYHLNEKGMEYVSYKYEQFIRGI